MKTTTTAKATTTTAFKPLEVASRKPGKEWVLRVVKTQRAADKLFAALAEACAEVRVRDAE